MYNYLKTMTCDDNESKTVSNLDIGREFSIDAKIYSQSPDVVIRTPKTVKLNKIYDVSANVIIEHLKHAP